LWQLHPYLPYPRNPSCGGAALQVYQEHILGFDPSAYTSQLHWAVSADGTRVPITLAYKRDLLKRDGTNKAILHA
jgi:oligopeptidase B